MVSKKTRDAEMELVFWSKKSLLTMLAQTNIWLNCNDKQEYNQLVIIQTYAPTSKYDDEGIGNFYCELQNVLNCVSNRDILLVHGDMNRKFW